MTADDKQALAEGVADAIAADYMTAGRYLMRESIVRHVRAALQRITPPVLTDVDGVRLEEIRARAEAASPGPWTLSGYGPKEIRSPACSGFLANVTLQGPQGGEANAQLMSASRSDIPYLLDLVHGLRAALTDALEDRGETERTQAAVKAERERIAREMFAVAGKSDWEGADALKGFAENMLNQGAAS